MSRSEIRLAVFHNNKPAAYVAARLTLLLKLRVVRFEKVPTGGRGRPSERWFAEEAPRINSKNSNNPPTAPEGEATEWEEVGL